MKVLQLIDSLETGGAERVAVNIANALSGSIDASYLCATRAEGILKNTLFKEVNYKFLNKKHTLDIKAFLSLHEYVKEENITIIHAHSSSFFLATLIKIFNGNIKIIWHDHYGNSDFLENRKLKILRLCSVYFNHIITVNSKLESWAKANLKSKFVSYVPNFAVINNTETFTTKLRGVNGKRIVCLANLRPQKNHLTLVQAFKVIQEIHPDWSLHIIGKDFNDSYSENIKKTIKELALSKNVFIYGTCVDTCAILRQCQIGVLSSQSEGLPIALLEYGLAGLATITTHVGQCTDVVLNQTNGLVVQPNSAPQLANAIKCYVENDSERFKHGEALKTHVETFFSEKTIIEKIKSIYNTLCD